MATFFDVLMWAAACFILAGPVDDRLYSDVTLNAAYAEKNNVAIVSAADFFTAEFLTCELNFEGDNKNYLAVCK